MGAFEKSKKSQLLRVRCITSCSFPSCFLLTVNLFPSTARCGWVVLTDRGMVLDGGTSSWIVQSFPAFHSVFKVL